MATLLPTTIRFRATFALTVVVHAIVLCFGWHMCSRSAFMSALCVCVLLFLLSYQPACEGRHHHTHADQPAAHHQVRKNTFSVVECDSGPPSYLVIDSVSCPLVDISSAVRLKGVSIAMAVLSFFSSPDHGFFASKNLAFHTPQRHSQAAPVPSGRLPYHLRHYPYCLWQPGAG